MRAALALVASLVLSCATTAREELSAAQHRQEAARERMLATQETSPYQVTVFPVDAKARTIDLAAHHLRHAEEHEAAAAALEASEELECRAIPPKRRAACPLLEPVQDVLYRNDGIRVVFLAGTDVAAMLAEMRCHLAFARARAFTGVAECPLYMRDVEITALPDGNAIEVRSRDPIVASEIKKRSETIH